MFDSCLDSGTLRMHAEKRKRKKRTVRMGDNENCVLLIFNSFFLSSE